MTSLGTKCEKEALRRFPDVLRQMQARIEAARRGTAGGTGGGGPGAAGTGVAAIPPEPPPAGAVSPRPSGATAASEVASRAAEADVERPEGVADAAAPAAPRVPEVRLARIARLRFEREVALAEADPGTTAEREDALARLRDAVCGSGVEGDPEVEAPPELVAEAAALLAEEGQPADEGTAFRLALHLHVVLCRAAAVAVRRAGFDYSAASAAGWRDLYPAPAEPCPQVAAAPAGAPWASVASSDRKSVV